MTDLSFQSSFKQKYQTFSRYGFLNMKMCGISYMIVFGQNKHIMLFSDSERKKQNSSIYISVGPRHM